MDSKAPSNKQSSKYLTAEAQGTRSKEFLVKKFSDLCELCASAVKIENRYGWKENTAG